MWSSMLPALALLLVAMTALWLLSLRLRDASIVDIFWGPSFALSAWTYLLIAPAPGPRAWLVTALITLWALRLGSHILLRNRGHGEDYRYRAMRESAGERFPRRSLFTVFWLQGVLSWVVGVPLAAGILAGPPSLGPWDLLGGSLFLVGFTVEALADLQLVRFKRKPENARRVCEEGLWRTSRHPNYFGNAVLWWGLYFVSVSAGGWWTIFSPVLMTLLLLRVSGVALLEKTIVERRPDYRSYIERTSAFVPWFPRRTHA